MSEEIAADIQAFMLSYVDSYEQLELLLLLRREAPRPWSAEGIADALRIPIASAASSLDELAGRGLLRAAGGEEPGYRYAPANDATADIVARLARAYDERRVAVVDLMSANAMSRIRRSALRTFSEAFRVKRPKNDG